MTVGVDPVGGLAEVAVRRHEPGRRRRSLARVGETGDGIEAPEPAHLRRRVIALSAALWLFCFASYYGAAFLWTDWAPPGWLLAFNALATACGFVMSLLLAAALARLDPRAGRGRALWAGVAVIASAGAQTLIDQQIWRELASHFIEPTARPATLGALLADFANAVRTPIGAFRLLTYLWLFGLFAAAVVLVLEVADGRRRQRQLVEAQRMMQHAQLAALRYQLDPHFLFNCLNSVSSLVVTGRAVEAETMMTRLSDFLRSTLATDPHAPSRLGDELDLLQQYLAVEGVRFEGGLDLEVDCPADLLAAVVPGFILQPLAENAVKHGAGGRTVSIDAVARGAELLISVRNPSNSGSGNAPRPGANIGLNNIRQRLRALYGAAARIDIERRPREFVARVILPLQFAV